MIVITGLKAEAKIAAAPGLKVFACGGNVRLRANAIRKAVFAGAPAIVSFGIAGGLNSRLIPGDWVVATGVIAGDRHIETDLEWSNRLAQRIPAAESAPILSVEDAVLHPDHKHRLHLETGAAAVDMESFQAAALAAELGVPFAAVRVIADSAHCEIPPAARLGLRPDGTVAIGAILGSLLRKPSQLPQLLRVSGDAMVAFRALLRGRERLGPYFASSHCPTVLASAALDVSEPDRQRSQPIPA